MKDKSRETLLSSIS